ncbi:hypothetical protein SAMN05216371_0515 [Streptomyces sp. TLI_053]|nr:hypothetical protein SAMN05216371_0515 [Streptomyces sp. TLI_053]
MIDFGRLTHLADPKAPPCLQSYLPLLADTVGPASGRNA